MSKGQFFILKDKDKIFIFMRIHTHTYKTGNTFIYNPKASNF